MNNERHCVPHKRIQRSISIEFPLTLKPFSHPSWEKLPPLLSLSTDITVSPNMTGEKTRAALPSAPWSITFYALLGKLSLLLVSRARSSPHSSVKAIICRCIMALKKTQHARDQRKCLMYIGKRVFLLRGLLARGGIVIPKKLSAHKSIDEMEAVRAKE